MQDAVKKTVRHILKKHKVKHLSLWQCIHQNDNGSWKSCYSNGLGCKTHKSVVIDWGGCAAAQLRYHLLKCGVTDKSALSLIKASFSPQAFRNALSATMKQGKVVSALQAEMEDEMEAIVKNTTWGDITMGMELGERAEYKNKLRAKASLLNPSSPEALNFEDDMTTKSINTAAARGSVYMVAFSALIRETAYVPGNVDSQESDILDESNEESIQEDDTDADVFGGIITNIDAIGKARTGPDTSMRVDGEQEGGAIMNTPQKLNHTATTATGFVPKASAVDYADEIKEMAQEWYKNHGGTELPPDLKELAKMSGITFTAPTNTHPTTSSRQGKCKKDNAITPTARDGAVQDSLEGLRFVISGIWPDLGGGAGLKIGKERVRARIKQFGGKVTLTISGVTDVLIIGEKLGPKKLIKALEKKVKVIDIDILNHLIWGELTLNEVWTLTAPDAEAPVHAVDHQVQHQSQTPTPTEQAHEGTAGPKGDPEFDHRNE